MTDTTAGAPSTEQWDLIVIGAGAVGENVADYATKGGLHVVIVEAELVGGECSYWACMPSKALLRPASARLAAQRVAGASAAVTGELDVAAVLERRTSFTSGWNDASQVEWLQGAGIDLVRGWGRITGDRRVDVTQPDGTVRRLSATHAVAVCTGSAPTMPPIDGLAEAKPWTSREATSVTEMPASIAIVGGGVVAAELATIYRALGSDVTMIVRSRLLGTLEDVASERVQASLEESGVRIITGSPSSVRRGEDGRVTIALGEDDAPVEADEIIVATGRHPATSDLGLEDIGVTPKDLHVDDSMRVSGVHGDWLYAVGDINGRALLTHQGKYQARAAGLAIAARASGTLSSAPSARPEPWTDYAATADHEHVPSVVFTEPEVATVGLTSTAATEAGHPVRVVDYDLGSVAGAAVHSDGYTGIVRAVIDTERRIILGMTFVGQDVSEMLHAATIAVVGEVSLDRLWHAVPAYPTMNEVWLRLLETERYA
jgi:dihydrolipoamide dehydrogenase